MIYRTRQCLAKDYIGMARYIKFDTFTPTYQCLTMLWRTSIFVVPFIGGVRDTAILEDGRKFEGFVHCAIDDGQQSIARRDIEAFVDLIK